MAANLQRRRGDGERRGGVPDLLAEPEQFARELRRWRTRRRFSQLDLAIRADTTQRHLSFLEQGRSRPRTAPGPGLAEFIEELDGYLPAPESPAGHLGFAVPLRLRVPEGELRLITTLTSFATAVDVTLSELRLEAFLPADETTAAILRRRGDGRRASSSECQGTTPPAPPGRMAG